MAEEFEVGGGNWWESSPSRLNQRFESSSGSSSSAAATAALHHNSNDVSLESSSFIGGWPTNLVLDSKPKSSLDSVSASGNDAALLSHHAFRMMGLGLSSQPIPCWNNPNSLFSSNSNASFQQDCCSYDYDKQMNRLSLDQPTPPLSLEGSTTSSDLDRSASMVLHQPAESSSPINFSSYDISQNYGMKPGGDIVGDVASPTWSKFPQFLRPKHPQFSHNTTFWNTAINDDAQFSLFPIDEKPKNISAGQGARDSCTAAKKTAGSTETSSKRPRDQNETPTPMPAAFKVRKEKMGDRITALQQLISPFGKTDTASVLSEAIEYIKFLHDQVNVLSTPYMKTGASMRHQLNFEKSKNPEIASKQDLRSRGLCLVPISSTTFPVTPTFGGCFR